MPYQLWTVFNVFTLPLLRPVLLLLVLYQIQNGPQRGACVCVCGVTVSVQRHIACYNKETSKLTRNLGEHTVRATFRKIAANLSP
jgi:hypothetical protein